jgi:hypothetical protein
MEEYAYDQSGMTGAGLSGPGVGYPMAKSLESAQIPRELSDQSAALDRLHATISELEARTTPLRLPKSERLSDPDTPQPVRSMIANEIAERTGTIEQATRRLQTILHELEL